jgi:hypothetical protein
MPATTAIAPTAKVARLAANPDPKGFVEAINKDTGRLELSRTLTTIIR